MRRGPRHSFNALLITYLLMILLMSGILTGTSYMVMFFMGFLPGFLLSHVGSPLGIIAMTIVFALMISVQVGKSKLRPINDLIRAMSRVSEGDFSVRVEEEDAPGEMGDLVHSFNEMAQELGGIEMFRKDFINNFSHEFKTPIVSIAGFAKLLKRGNLSEAQQAEYLNIIEEESLRLSYMATNVLNLTKVENQSILTDVSEYNLSEQLRASILLLERKWSKKQLQWQLDFGEHGITANEELLKQVWINLLDNAIKFSPQGGTVAVRITEQAGHLSVSVHNAGSTITPEEQEKVFHKFYQADASHSSEGNGIGLAIVKRVVELHQGTVSVHSENGETIFTVALPAEQKKGGKRT